MNELSNDRIMGTLDKINADLENRVHVYEHAARDYHKHKRDVEMILAKTRAGLEGAEHVRKDSALKELAYGESKEMYATFVLAEAEFEAQKAAINTLIARSNIGLGLLKAQTRLES